MALGQGLGKFSKKARRSLPRSAYDDETNSTTPTRKATKRRWIVGRRLLSIIGCALVSVILGVTLLNAGGTPSSEPAAREPASIAFFGDPACIPGNGCVTDCDCSTGVCTAQCTVTSQTPGTCGNVPTPCKFTWSITTSCPSPCPDGMSSGTDTTVNCDDSLELSKRCGTGFATLTLTCAACPE